MMKWVADQWASRQKLSPEESAKYEERGTLLASGLIAGEAITGIMLAALFLTGITSLTKLFTGLNSLPFVAPGAGGYRSSPSQLSAMS
jgi:hypothetical protein